MDQTVYLASFSRTVPFNTPPLNRVGTITKITRAAEKLEAEVERQPKGDEIGAQLEMSGDEVLMAMHTHDAIVLSTLHFRKEKIVVY